MKATLLLEGPRKVQDPDSSSKELTGLCPRARSWAPDWLRLHQELQGGLWANAARASEGTEGMGARHFIRTHPHCAAVHRVTKNKTQLSSGTAAPSPPHPRPPEELPSGGCRHENSSAHNIRRVGRWLERHRAVGWYCFEVCSRPRVAGSWEPWALAWCEAPPQSLSRERRVCSSGTSFVPPFVTSPLLLKPP